MHRFQRGFDQALALRLQVLGEFHDQDGVLRRQADGGDQAHLEVHVVGHSAQRHAEQRTEHAQRHHQQHRERDRPAFIQRGQAQEHDDQRQRVQDRFLRAGQAFFIRLAGPLEAEARRQLGEVLFHHAHGFTGTAARRGLARQLHRRHAVVALQARRAHHPLGGRERGKRHHVAVAVAHAQLGQVVRQAAVRAFCLHDHLTHPTFIDEVVDVVRAERNRQRRVDAGHGDAERLGLLAVDIDLQLRRVFLAFRAHAHQHRALGRHAQHHVARFHQLGVALAGAVLQAEVKARGVAQLGNRRRVEREDDRVLDERQRAEGTAHQRLRGLAVAGALLPVLQAYERDTAVLAAAEEGEARHRDHLVNHLAFLLQVVVLDLLEHADGTVLGGAVGQLHHGDHVALVFVGQER